MHSVRPYSQCNEERSRHVPDVVEMIDEDPRDYIEVGNFNKILGFILGVELTLIFNFIVAGVTLTVCINSIVPGIFAGAMGYLLGDTFVELFG